MSSLLAPASLGDALDRLTILAIKLDKIPEPRRAHVAAEHAALRAAWFGAGLGDPTSALEYPALIEVNRALWDVEDRLRAREASGDFGAGFVDDARAVYRLNDARAAIKRTVNDRLGSSLREEKLHPAYASPPPAAPGDAPPLTHLDAAGNARMVEVGDKAVTRRSATAEAWVRMGPDTLARLRRGDVPKGNVLLVAQIAGIQAAKRTWELVPLCHLLPLDGVDVTLDVHDRGVHIRATARVTARTGVEMEALTAVSVAALTVYDMLKAVERGMTIDGVRLLEKSGGRSGSWRSPD